MEEEEEEKQPKQTVCSAVWVDRRDRKKRGRERRCGVTLVKFFFLAFSGPDEIMFRPLPSTPI